MNTNINMNLSNIRRIHNNNISSSNKIPINKHSNDLFTVVCPHCYQEVIIQENEINCAVFRHGIMKSNYQQIPPHAPKDVCDMLVKKDLIYGCGKPFTLIKQSSVNSNKVTAINKFPIIQPENEINGVCYKAVACDYI